MKKSILRSEVSTRFKQQVSGSLSFAVMANMKAMLLTVFVLCFSACKQDADQQISPSGVSDKVVAKASAQPLPGGKARFTWVNGNFDMNGYSWERIVNLTFTASTGTVGATLYTWDSTVKKGKAAYNSHTCTFDGVTKTCSTYTPGGWVYPTGQYVSWSGTYVYNTSTGRLDITWTTGASATESWTITNPTSAIARAVLITSSYTLTHGRGYGSNAAWSTYKTMAQMVPFPTFGSNSRSVGVAATTSTGTPYYLSGTGWSTSGLDLSGFTTASATTPSTSKTAHLWNPGGAYSPSMCNANPRPGAIGVVYHLATLNSGRAMAYTTNAACLSSATEWPCYTRNLHPCALTQIIDDNNNLVALIGIEAQNPVAGDSGNPGYQFQLFDFNNIP